MSYIITNTITTYITTYTIMTYIVTNTITTYVITNTIATYITTYAITTYITTYTIMTYNNDLLQVPTHSFILLGLGTACGMERGKYSLNSGVVDLAEKNSIRPGKFPRNSDFSRHIS